MTQATYRVAIVKTDPAIAAYMPGNYVAIDVTGPDASGETTYIVGQDAAGWTLDDYVIPRLASGGHFAKEVPLDPANMGAVVESIGPLDRAVLIAQAKRCGYFPFADLEGHPDFAGFQGRLDGSKDRELTIALDVLVGEGSEDERGGDVEAGLHACRFGRFVLTTDTQGFLDVEVFDDDEYAERFLASLEPAAGCEECNGTGKWNDYNGDVLVCETCKGAGTLDKFDRALGEGRR